MNRNIRTQLLIVNTAVLLLIFSIMSVYLVSKSTSNLRGSLRNEVEAFTTLATAPIGDAYSIYGESGTGRIRETIRSYIGVNDSIANATVVDLNGKPLFSYAAKDGFTITAKEASTFTPIFNRDNLEHVIYPYFGASGAHSYTVVYTISNEQIESAIRSQTISLLVFSVLSLLLTSVVTYAAINRIILNPIRAVSQQAAAISAGNLEQQISVSGNNEIASLGRAMNAMAESLKANITKLQEIDKVKSEFMAITSHNLRTPITIISSYLENIDLLNTVDELKVAMNRIAESVKRLGGFAEDVLIISRFELGEENSTKERIVISDFMRRISKEAEATADMRELRFVSDIKSHADILVSAPHLRSAIWNLIDNAVKFTPKGGTIYLTVKDNNKTVSISVKDNGIGISKDEIPKLFTKFHRATSVERYNYEGTGIGLYASKIIVEEQNGHITAVSEESKGSTFTITLPIAPTVT